MLLLLDAAPDQRASKPRTVTPTRAAAAAPSRLLHAAPARPLSAQPQLPTLPWLCCPVLSHGELTVPLAAVAAESLARLPALHSLARDVVLSRPKRAAARRLAAVRCQPLNPEAFKRGRVHTNLVNGGGDWAWPAAMALTATALRATGPHGGLPPCQQLRRGRLLPGRPRRRRPLPAAAGAPMPRAAAPGGPPCAMPATVPHLHSASAPCLQVPCAVCSQPEHVLLGGAACSASPTLATHAKRIMAHHCNACIACTACSA